MYYYHINQKCCLEITNCQWILKRFNPNLKLNTWLKRLLKVLKKITQSVTCITRQLYWDCVLLRDCVLVLRFQFGGWVCRGLFVQVSETVHSTENIENHPHDNMITSNKFLCMAQKKEEREHGGGRIKKDLLTILIFLALQIYNVSLCSLNLWNWYILMFDEFFWLRSCR